MTLSRNSVWVKFMSLGIVLAFIFSGITMLVSSAPQTQETSSVSDSVDVSVSDIVLSDSEPVSGTPVTITANLLGDNSVMNDDTQKTLVFNDDFESGTLNKWIKSTWYSGSVLEVTTAQSSSPIYSFRAQSNPGTNSGPYIMKFLDDNYAHSITETKFYLPVKAQSVDKWDIIRVGSSTGTVFSTTNYEFYVQLRDDDYSIDLYEYVKDASGVWNYGCLAMDVCELAPQTWHDISLEITPTEYTLRVNGADVANGQRTVSTLIHHLLIGDEGGVNGCWGDSYWDDVKVWSVTGNSEMVHDAQDATCTVSFYLDSMEPENLIGSVENVFVPADGQTPVSVDWNPVPGEHDIIVAISEVNPADRDMSNNVAGLAIVVAEAGHVDLSISSEDISLSDEEPVAGTPVTITANVLGDRSTSSEWVKHGVALDLGGWGEDQLMAAPSILKLDNGTYLMYYHGKANDGTTFSYRMFRAFSHDGITWQKQGMVLNYGGPYANNAVYYPYVWIAPDGTYHMWYSGQNLEGGSNRARILHATSQDGFNFVYDGLELNFGGSIEPAGVATPFVLPDDSGYRMWYTGIAWSPLRNWNNHAHKSELNDPWIRDGTILQNNGVYDNPITSRPWILETDSGYEMFYTGVDAAGVGRILHAVSQDGNTWTKDGIVIEPSLQDEGNCVRWCSVLREGETYKMWYTGFTGTVNKIMYAEKAPGNDALDATCTVSFYLDSVSPENLIDSVENVFVPADGETPVSIDWVPVAGEHEIIVVVSDVNPTDRDLMNNVASLPVSVSSPEPEPASLAIEKVKLSGIDEGITHTYYEWELQITVTNTGGADALDVVAYDVLPAELGLLEIVPSMGHVTYTGMEGTRAAPVGPTILPVRSTHITWTVGTLAPGQSETLYLRAGTRLNPAEKQEFTSPGTYIINEGAYAEGTDSLTGDYIVSLPANAISVTITDPVESVIIIQPKTSPPKTWFFMVMVFACFLPGYRKKR